MRRLSFQLGVGRIRYEPGRRILARIFLLVIPLTLRPAPAQAQYPGIVSGMVRDSTGVSIIGAEVALVGTTTAVTTGERGQFLMSAPEGLVTLRARRLGYTPASMQVQVTPQSGAKHVEIVLSLASTTIKPIVVKADRLKFTGRLAGYYERLAHHNGGYFISRDQIDRENPRMLSQLLTHVPGVSSVRMRRGGGGVRMRGRNCWPIVWLDGLPMGAAEVDLDAFPPQTIHGIELYLGSTTAPMKYIAERDMSSCGTILLWSRGPDTDPVTAPPRPKWDLQQMVASLTVYTSEQVDKPAQLDSVQRLSVTYPAPLFASGVRGAVVAEFVVDERGQVEEGTFGVVSSTHPLFTEAVRAAVEQARFTPAIRQGVRVRQLLQQPFSFTPKSAKHPRG